MIQQQHSCSRKYASLVLARLFKTGLLEKIERNRYTAMHDIALIACNIHTPSYISGIFLSNYYGFSEQLPIVITVMTPIYYSSVEFQGYTIEFHKTSNMIGFSKQITPHGALFLATPEKLLIDCVMMPEIVGNPDEIIKIVKEGNCSSEVLTQLLTQINDQSLWKRVGYLLETYKHISLPHKVFDSNYVDLHPWGVKKPITKWRVRV